jgi:hypothetical protein
MLRQLQNEAKYKDIAIKSQLLFLTFIFTSYKPKNQG